jgi:hypothetical protein
MQSDEQLRTETGRQPDNLRGRLVTRQLDQLRAHPSYRLDGHPVVRSPEQLRLHRALDELDWVGMIGELNEAVRLRNSSVAEPILITTNGTILAGFGRWRSAVFDGRHEINCIEYSLSEDEALQFIIRHHQPQRGWNAFTRIRLALTQEPYFQQQALENMRAGGKYKGLANLPEAQHIDVRQEIASAAGVGARNVGNVKTILRNAHPRLITALLNGTLTVNGAMPLCRQSEDREINKVIRRSVSRPNEEKTSADVATVLDALQQQEARQPGSVLLQFGRFRRTAIVIGQDLLAGPYSQKELDLHEIPRPSPTDSVSETAVLGPG